VQVGIENIIVHFHCQHIITKNVIVCYATTVSNLTYF